MKRHPRIYGNATRLLFAIADADLGVDCRDPERRLHHLLLDRQAPSVEDEGSDLDSRTARIGGVRLRGASRPVR